MVQAQATDLLIAPPGAPDSRFKNTVLMLTHDHQAGAFALCVNRETHHTLQDLLEEADMKLDIGMNFPLYWGGPVSPNTIWMLHSSEWSIPETVEISAEWSMTSNIDMFSIMAQGDYPQFFRIMFGYCSWKPGQLHCELEGIAPWRKEHSWLVAHNMGPEWLFEQPVEDVWTTATTLSSHQAVDSWF